MNENIEKYKKIFRICRWLDNLMHHLEAVRTYMNELIQEDVLDAKELDEFYELTHKILIKTYKIYKEKCMLR